MQRNFPFLAILPAPKAAPASLVARIQTDAQAMAVSLIGHKHSYIAAQLCISAGYLSQMLHGKTVPDWLVTPFCALTGTQLFAQFRRLQEAQRIADGLETEADAIRHLAAQLRNAA